MHIKFNTNIIFFAIWRDSFHFGHLWAPPHWMSLWTCYKLFSIKYLRQHLHILLFNLNIPRCGFMCTNVNAVKKSECGEANVYNDVQWSASNWNEFSILQNDGLKWELKLCTLMKARATFWQERKKGTNTSGNNSIQQQKQYCSAWQSMWNTFTVHRYAQAVECKLFL